MSNSFDDAPLWSEREREQASEIDRLTALLGETNDALAACQSEGEAWKRLAQEAGDCLSEANHWREGLAGVELDATRYRWIRHHNKVGGKVTVELECDPPELCTCETGHKPHELDEAIDAAMRATATVTAAQEGKS